MQVDSEAPTGGLERRGSDPPSVPRLSTPPRSSFGQEPRWSSKNAFAGKSDAFQTPLLQGLFAKAQPRQSSPPFCHSLPSVAECDSPQIDPLASSRSGIAVPKGGDKLEITLINHPSAEGVIVQDLGTNGACAKCGIKVCARIAPLTIPTEHSQCRRLRDTAFSLSHSNGIGTAFSLSLSQVGDHITKVNGKRARDHRTAIWLVDAAESRVSFSLADASHSYILDRAAGDVGLTLVNNTTAGFGVVVVRVTPGLGAAHAGLEVGHVLLSIDGELALNHKDAIQRMDGAMKTVELVVASRKLTEENVLRQHIGQVPVSIVVTA